MVERLREKAVLITDAAQGQGAAEAKLFAAGGAKLVLGDVKEEEVAADAEELSEQSREAVARRLDVISEEDWEVAVAEAEEHFGRLDVLVSSVGIHMSPASSTPPRAAGQDDHDKPDWMWLGMEQRSRR